MAEDLWELEMHVASWGGVELDVLSTADEVGRASAIHHPAYRNGGTVEDVGGNPRSTACQIIFRQRDASDDHLARLFDFEAMKREGIARTFTHPLTGSFEAKITEFGFRASAEPRDCVMVDATFVEDSDEPAIFDLGGGAPLMSSVEAVSAAAAEYDAAAAGVPDAGTTIGADAIAAVTAWQDGDSGKTIRDVNLEVVGLHNRVEDEIARLELATDISRFPLLRSITALEYSLRRAAEVFIERTPRIVEFTVGAPTNLLTLVTRRFGAQQAPARFEELRKLNDIRNPARIEPGTKLRAQADTAPRRLRSPT